MKEKEIQSAIMSLLLTHPRVAWAYVTSSGTVKGVHGGRPFKIGIPGMADIIGQMRDGRILAIEVKQEGKKPTDLQLAFINTVAKHGGVSGWATCVTTAKAIIDEAINENRD